jgi:RND family efflux transporter MFP subunit
MMLTSRAKRIAPGAAALVLFLMAFLGVRHERQRPAPTADQEILPAPVSVEVGYDRLARIKKYPAEIQPWIDAEIRCGVAGLVLGKLVEPGALVKKGAPLIRMDETSARNAADSELARHSEASGLLVETERLQKTGAVGPTALEASLAEVRGSRGRLDRARELLARHTVRAPISGVLTILSAKAGDTVELNQLIGVVADVEKLRVFIHVPKAEAGFFKPGERFLLRMGRETHRPEILFVHPTADPQTGLIKIEAVLNNPNRDISAKTPSTVEIETEAFPAGPVVPAQAVRFTENGTIVLREEKGNPVPIPVRVGSEIDGWYPVLEGLQAGERVFIEGLP